MAGYKGKQGRKPKASTIVDRLREQGRTPNAVKPRLPAVPAHLPPTAKAEWRRIGRQLADAGLLTALDTTALALYCEAYARWLEARAILDGPVGRCANCDPSRQPEQAGLPACVPPRHTAHPYGTIVRNRLGAITPSPYLRIASDAGAQMIKLLAEFGMTPASRGRIPREQPESKRRPAPDWENAPEMIDPREHLMVIEGGKVG